MISSIVGRNLRKILLFFNILLGSLGAWMLFDVVSFWVSPPDGGREHAIWPKVEVASTQATLVAPRSLKDYEALSKADIFRISPRTNPMEARTNPGGPNGTSLDLKLKGTIIETNAQSYAVIEDRKTKTQLLYSLNELIQGARITAIEPDHVVLSVQGKTEVLTMSEEDEPLTVSVSPPSRRLPPEARRAQRNRESGQPAIKSKPPARIVQTDQGGASTQDQKSPSEGDRPGDEGSQSDILDQ